LRPFAGSSFGNRTDEAPENVLWGFDSSGLLPADPDPLFEEFRQRGVSFVKELSFIDDGLWGLEITDADGYVIASFK